MEAKKQIWGVGENMGTEESKKIWEENAQFWDKKRPSTFRIVRPVNGLIFGIYFSKLAGGEQHFMLFADGKSTGCLLYTSRCV